MLSCPNTSCKDLMSTLPYLYIKVAAVCLNLCGVNLLGSKLDNNIYFFDSDILRNMCNYPSFWNEGRIACVDKANRRYKIVFDIDRFLHMYNKTAQYLLLGSA